MNQGCPLIPEVIQLRERARIEKDWQAADAAREKLAQMGIIVIDTENGPIWQRVRELV